MHFENQYRRESCPREVRDGTRIFQSGSWDPHVWSNWGLKHFGWVRKSWSPSSNNFLLLLLVLQAPFFFFFSKLPFGYHVIQKKSPIIKCWSPKQSNKILKEKSYFFG